MKRPLGLTILAVYLGTLAVRAISHLGDERFRPLTDPTIARDLIITAAGIAAGVAAVGIWRMQGWAYKAVGVVAVLVVSLMIVEQATVETGTHLPLALATALVAVLHVLGVRYVHGTIQERAAADR